MKFCVFGAGAVGGHFAVRLTEAGHDVCVVTRGRHLQAIRQHGLTLQSGEETLTTPVQAAETPEALGPQDVVLVTLKGPSLQSFAEAGAPLLHDRTVVVFAQNGIPWWYGDKIAAARRPNTPDLAWLDPDQQLRRMIGIEQSIGAVIFSSNEVARPGVIRNDSPGRNTLWIGELDDRSSERIAALRAVLEAAQIRSPATDDLRQVLWSKLLGNMTVSVLCMLTGLTAREAVEDPMLEGLLRRLLIEANAVARAHGMDLPFDPDAPVKAPDHKPSLLQDLELGRPLEIDALVRAPLQFARAAGVDTPTLDALGALALQRAAAAGLLTPSR